LSFTRRDALNWAELSVTAANQLDDTGVRYPSTGLCLAATAVQNINALSAENLVLWDTHEAEWGADLFHRTTSDTHKITILTAGTYELSASVAFDAQSSAAARYNGIARFKLNGTTDFGPEGKGGYVRDATGHDESSVHIQTFPKTFAALDYIYLKVDREATPTGIINTTPGASSLYIRRIA
jgi:hypothetical protein